ncbi:FAD-dependent monooxygenase [Conservatibacter flavescens]|uniref:FAD-dependent 2-octaprenylphenol hydroxylase n=1 Tax=Conservatibacter flavescens TaxID=28161 RepID=A0A2M8S067_9PAST|nr:FAD-dependent monooxygenase [Conservatibacter flavescens]PJG84537.1 FAD-dependent 2-octaprenylphenol hydroxylase [Conservatibacter flavescens]
MKHVDVIIIGGGMVGLALAARLKQSSLSLCIIEAFPPALDFSSYAPRVSALNLSSEKLLQQIGIWQELQQLRLTPYDKMTIWEKDSFGRLDFTTQGLGINHLGHIAENHLIQGILWQHVMQQKNVDIITALPHRLDINPHTAILQLDNHEMISAKLVVGADGANSWVRQQANIPLVFHDYGHHALVCNVNTQEPHNHCARQIFSSDSILAFLPLDKPNLCSIVWSLPPEQAKQLHSCDEISFNKALNVAFDGQLGLCQITSERKIFPLTARYARNFAHPRIALIGDAAHTIHPLAGLGVNLGFQDVESLAKTLLENEAAHLDIGEYRYLRHYERTRKVEAMKMLAAMQGLKSLFEGDHPLKKWVRGIGLATTQQLNFVKDQLIKQALNL